MMVIGRSTAMGSLGSLLLFLWLTFILLNSSINASAASLRTAYPAIFVFGDSLSDPGNKAIASNSSYFITLHSPYGETFPGWPFGRFSDGRTIVDFLATYMDLPLLSPFLNGSADFRAGVNYAIAGATALNTSFLNSLGIYPAYNFSLDILITSHLTYKASVESSNGFLADSPTAAAFAEGLYVMAIGGDDYGYAYSSSKSTSFVTSTLIPLVIRKIHDAVEILLDNGAQHFLFISITPSGCSPVVLAQYDGTEDSDGCLEEYNLPNYLHGVRLQEEVENLRGLYPQATFLLMDYYGAYKYVLQQKEMFGFANTLEACCGAGASYPYNFNPLETCNQNSISICSNPDQYMSWDGSHFTESLNRQIFNQTFIMGSYLDTPYSLHRFFELSDI